MTAFETFHIFPSVVAKYRAEGVIPIEQSIEIDHGESALYPMIWIHAVNNYNSFWGNIIWHTYIYIFNFLGTICLYFLIKELMGKKVAILTTLLYFWTPALFAHAHYNNKDSVLLTLAIIVYYLAYRLSTKNNLKYAILLGIAGGFFANMKIIGIPVWGFVVVCVLAEKIIRKKCDKKFIFNVIVASVTAIVSLYILTPAMWKDVVHYVKFGIEQAQDFRWCDYVLFNGQIVSKSLAGIPRKYLPFMIIFTTPVGILLLDLLGIVGTIVGIAKKKIDSKYLYAIYVSICALFPVGYVVIKAIPLYNSWRHFYFVYSSIIMLAALGINFLVTTFKKNKLSVIIIGIYAGFLMIESIVTTPFQFAYYNEVARFFVEDKYEVDYWDMSFKSDIEYIVKVDSRDKITISGCDNPTKWGINPAIRSMRGRDRLRIEMVEDWKDADYVIINYDYSILYSAADRDYILAHYEPIKVAKVYGYRLSGVYKRVE